MSERNLSRRLVKKVAPRVTVWERIENSAGVGTPDVYGETLHGPFWCELKHVHEYPKRPTTPIRFHRYTIEQANTIARLGKSGNVASWILIQVENDHWLFNWRKAHDLQLMQPRMWWNENAARMWQRRLDYDQLIGMLGIPNL